MIDYKKLQIVAFNVDDPVEIKYQMKAGGPWKDLKFKNNTEFTEWQRKNVNKVVDVLMKLNGKWVDEAGDPRDVGDTPFEISYVEGVKNISKRKKFKNRSEYDKWFAKNKDNIGELKFRDLE